MRSVARTHIGRIRKSNQDALLVMPDVYPIYAVADGMGGHRGGDIASLMAIEGLKALYGMTPSLAAIDACYQRITHDIYQRQQADDYLSGMGTTLTMLWEGPESVLLGHVGDSRAYLLREGQLTQVSNDHSLVGEMVRSGALARDAARSSPYRNVITRAVGTEDRVLCDTAVFDKMPGDRWLLCSDGLSEHLDARSILECLMMNDLETSADRMVVGALEAGGRDNITLILLEVPR